MYTASLKNKNQVSAHGESRHLGRCLCSEAAPECAAPPGRAQRVRRVARQVASGFGTEAGKREAQGQEGVAAKPRT